MFFIGIVTNQKNELFIKEKLENITPDSRIIFITEKNIDNIKNIKFETILLDTQIIKKKKEIRKIISSCKYLVINNDIEIDDSIIESMDLTIITYGFNGKSTFTISSIDENKLIICLQRIIFKENNMQIEPQEYEVKINKNVDKYAIIGSEVIRILYSEIL